MKTFRPVVFLTALAAGLMLSLSGCYTRVMTDDEDVSSYQEPDTTYQRGAGYDKDDNGQYDNHTYIGFEYYTPAPYWGYDPWSYGYYYSPWYYNPWYSNSWYYSSWYYSPWYYGAGFIGYPFLSYPYYPYPMYSVYHNGYGSYAYASYVTRNSGSRRTGSSRGAYDNSGRGSAGLGGSYVPSPGSGNSIPTRYGNRTRTNPNSSTVNTPTRSGRTGSVQSGGNNTPTRGNTRQQVPARVYVPSRTDGQHQGTSTGGNRSGGYSRNSGETQRGQSSRPASAPAYTPPRSSAPNNSPPPSSNGGGRSSGGDNRSSGGSRGRGR
jgi:hypothetical protein